MIRKSLKIAKSAFANFNANKDYYKTLGVKVSSTPEQIKKAFIKLAKEKHPDSNKGGEQMFKQINQAYQVLSSQVIKKDYDQARKPKSSTFERNYNTNQRDYDQNFQQRSTYRGYQQQQGWNNRKFRQQSLNDMFKQQQERYEKSHQHYYQQKTSHSSQQFDETIRKRSTNNQTENKYDSYQQYLKKQQKITMQSVRKAYQAQQKRRQKQFQQYKDKQKHQFIDSAKRKAWQAAQGIKNNVQGAIKAGKFVKDGIREMSKFGSNFVKQMWDQYKQYNSKNKKK